MHVYTCICVYTLYPFPFIVVAIVSLPTYNSDFSHPMEELNHSCCYV